MNPAILGGRSQTFEDVQNQYRKTFHIKRVTKISDFIFNNKQPIHTKSNIDIMKQNFTNINKQSQQQIREIFLKKIISVSNNKQGNKIINEKNKEIQSGILSKTVFKSDIEAKGTKLNFNIKESRGYTPLRTELSNTYGLYDSTLLRDRSFSNKFRMNLSTPNNQRKSMIIKNVELIEKKSNKLRIKSENTQQSFIEKQINKSVLKKKEIFIQSGVVLGSTCKNTLSKKNTIKMIKNNSLNQAYLKNLLRILESMLRKADQIIKCMIMIDFDNQYKQYSKLLLIQFKHNYMTSRKQKVKLRYNLKTNRGDSETLYKFLSQKLLG